MGHGREEEGTGSVLEEGVILPQEAPPRGNAKPADGKKEVPLNKENSAPKSSGPTSGGVVGVKEPLLTGALEVPLAIEPLEEPLPTGALEEWVFTAETVTIEEDVTAGEGSDEDGIRGAATPLPEALERGGFDDLFRLCFFPRAMVQRLHYSDYLKYVGLNTTSVSSEK